MIIVNFSHPLTPEQQERIEELAGQPVERVIDVPAQFDEEVPFAEQVPPLVTAAGLTPEEWQTLPILVNLPSYAPIVATLLAYLHGLLGYFPSALRIRPERRGGMTVFTVAEILSLQEVRDHARGARLTPRG